MPDRPGVGEQAGRLRQDAAWPLWRQGLFGEADGPRLSRYVFLCGRAGEVEGRRRRQALGAVRAALRRLAGTATPSPPGQPLRGATSSRSENLGYEIASSGAKSRANLAN
ncbi:MAG: hypothetical protein K6T75_03945 [Acetobacteraceae bacterium]|nr:hypothetical protein [Acetobacteraceae bacterium]